MSINKDSSQPTAPRSFPSIEGNTRGAIGRDEFIPMECQLMSKMLDWHSFRILRVTPLKIFRGSSRPMRSQHSKLSTNEKPRFRPKSQCPQNLESSNLTPICQLTVIPIYWQPKGYQWMSIGKAFSIDCYSNSLTIDCQFKANWLLMECLLDSNWLPTDFQLESHFGGPRLYSTASSQPMAPRSFPSIEGNNRGARGWDEFIPIQYKLTANWMSIDCQLNPIQIDSQLNVNSLPIECQLVKIHLNLWLLGRFPL